jgi:hypothetical protein
VFVLLPPFPATDGGQAQHDPADQGGAIVPQPGADSFALLVFVEQVV